MKGDGVNMEIIGRILFFAGIFVAVISQIYIMTFVFIINYRSGLPFIVLPTLALVNEDLRKNNHIRVCLKLCAASLPMLILGAYVLAVA